MKSLVDLAGLSITEEGREYGWSPSSGYYAVRTWKGTQAQIDNLIPALQTDGYEYSITEGPLYTCRAKITYPIDEDGNPQAEVPVPTYEIIPQRIDREFLLSSAGAAGYLNPEIKRLITECIRDGTSPSFLTGSYNNGIYRNESEKELAAKIYQELLSGATQYTMYVPTLRVNRLASNKWVVNVSISNVNRVFSKATLISWENVPNTIHGILPNSGLYTAIVSPPSGIPGTTTVETVFGYLRTHPTYNQVAPNLWQISVDYNYGQYSVLQYGSLL